MADQPSLTDADMANLVAYLDGELDRKTAQALEAKLVNDPKARAEADALRKVWDLLEYLPRTEPSPSFTHQTLDRVSAMRPARKAAQRLWRKQVALGVGWAASLVLAALCGYGAVWLVPPAKPDAPAEDRDELLARDLRVIDNLRLYQGVDDVHFLRALDHPDLFGDDSSNW